MLKIQLVPKQVIKFNRATMEQNSTRCLREKKAKVDSSAILHKPWQISCQICIKYSQMAAKRINNFRLEDKNFIESLRRLKNYLASISIDRGEYVFSRFMTQKHFSFQLSLLPLVFSLFLRSSKVFFFIKVQRKEGKTTLQEIVNREN